MDTLVLSSKHMIHYSPGGQCFSGILVSLAVHIEQKPALDFVQTLPQGLFSSRCFVFAAAAPSTRDK